MPALNLHFEPVQAISTWLEPPEFRLVLQNPHLADVPIRSDWYASVRLSVFHPDGSVTTVYPFGEPSLAGAAIGVAQNVTQYDDEILGRSDRERRFTIANMGIPGLYVIIAKLTSEARMYGSASWFLEAPGPLSVAISSLADLPVPRAWILSPGVKQATLFRMPMGWTDFSDPTPVRSGSPGREAVALPDANGLVASALQDTGHDREHERVAWLSGNNALHVGVTSVLFDEVAVTLPGPARCILAPLVIDADGTCHVFVLSENGRAVWIYRGQPAIPREPPPVPPISIEEETRELTLEDLEVSPDDEEIEPGFLPGADVPPLELTGTIELPFAATYAGVAGNAGHSAIVVAADAGGSIDVLCLRLDASLASGGSSRSRIVGANLIPGCNPWIGIDQNGMARVALLFHEPDPRSPAVGLAKLAIDGSDVVWQEGVGRQRIGILRSEPVGGAMAGSGEEGWPRAWCVRTEEELVGSWIGSPPRSRPIQEPPVQPLVFLASSERLAVAVESNDGVTFVRV